MRGSPTFWSLGSAPPCLASSDLRVPLQAGDGRIKGRAPRTDRLCKAVHAFSNLIQLGLPNQRNGGLESTIFVVTRAALFEACAPRVTMLVGLRQRLWRHRTAPRERQFTKAPCRLAGYESVWHACSRIRTRQSITRCCWRRASYAHRRPILRVSHLRSWPATCLSISSCQVGSRPLTNDRLSRTVLNFARHELRTAEPN